MAEIARAERVMRETSFESPSVRRFEDEQSLPARVQRGKARRRSANKNETGLLQEAANDNYPEDAYETAEEKPSAKKTSFLVRRAKFRVAWGICIIACGLQTTFALMAAGTLVLLPISLALWLIACLASIGGFVAIRAWLGVEVFSNVSLAICTICMVIASIIPLVNIIPWMSVWVWTIYINGEDLEPA